MKLVDLAKQQLSGSAAVVQLGIGDAVLLQRMSPSSIESTLYRPLMCVVLQGAKTVTSGEITVHSQAGQSIIVSHDLPVLSEITNASAASPYIALVIPLDMSILRGFYDELVDEAVEIQATPALATYAASDELLDVSARLLRLCQQPNAAALLGPILLREFHARLLLSEQGANLRRFLSRDDPSTQLARAIASIKSTLAQPLSVGQLAALVGMSKSSFHAHFKAVIGLSPGQYQKDIRLLEARRMVTQSEQAISAIAYAVGYESPSQFSRDYSAKFGLAPRLDRKQGLSVGA